MAKKAQHNDHQKHKESISHKLKQTPHHTTHQTYSYILIALVIISSMYLVVQGFGNPEWLAQTVTGYAVYTEPVRTNVIADGAEISITTCNFYKDCNGAVCYRGTFCLDKDMKTRLSKMTFKEQEETLDKLHAEGRRIKQEEATGNKLPAESICVREVWGEVFYGFESCGFVSEDKTVDMLCNNQNGCCKEDLVKSYCEDGVLAETIGSSCDESQTTRRTACNEVIDPYNGLPQECVVVDTTVPTQTKATCQPDCSLGDEVVTCQTTFQGDAYYERYECLSNQNIAGLDLYWQRVPGVNPTSCPAHHVCNPSKGICEKPCIVHTCEIHAEELEISRTLNPRDEKTMELHHISIDGVYDFSAHELKITVLDSKKDSCTLEFKTCAKEWTPSSGFSDESCSKPVTKTMQLQEQYEYQTADQKHAITLNSVTEQDCS